MKTSLCLLWKLTYVQQPWRCLKCHLLTMSPIDDEPSCEHFPEGCIRLPPKQRWNLMNLATKHLLDKFVDISYPKASTKKDDDQVCAYAEELMSLSHLLMEFVNSIREGDGECIIRCWRYFLPLFEASKCKNYAIEAFNLLFQYEYAFTPRMRQQLMWERTVNMHGRPGRNISMDLHMEHIIRACKSPMVTLGPNTNEESVNYIGKSIEEIMKITDQYDRVNSIPVKLDMEKLLTQLHCSNIFNHIPGWHHAQFPKFQENLTCHLAPKTLKQWMTKTMQDIEM